MSINNRSVLIKEMCEISYDFLIDLQDDGFNIKTSSYDNRYVKIKITHEENFKVGDIQNRVLMIREYFKGQYINIDFLFNNVLYRYFPFFKYNKTKKFEIVIKTK